MCDAVSIALTALSALKTVTDYQASNDAADAQAEAAQRQYADNMAALEEQQNQINQQAADQQSARALEAMKERGRLNATAGEMGVSGNSVDKALQESLFNEGTDISMIEANRRNGIVQNTRSMSSAGVQLAGNINQANAGRGTLISAGLGIGTAIGSGYLMHEQRMANKQKSTEPTKGTVKGST